ncbi:response regulator [Dyadobacter luticola]|uniref:Response regulator n=1 Tax=Dyadobacter luticola TaxID=1979387 RepID=A0A5R9L2V0_9BACT|nr:response regulator [Dyadobacter luticola]TLV02580.1 response regulator [Dyadobacter luticola]
MEFIIIDDSAFDLFTQEKLLLKSGLASKVQTFFSPQTALEHLRSHSSGICDTVILVDLQMPELNGFEFAERYGLLPEEVRGHIRLFMISSTVDSSDIDEAESNPHIIKLLSKPLEIPVLKGLLNEC